MNPLSELHTDIDARVESIRDGRPDWLCGKGCDSCCKRLAEAPRLTQAEWNLLREGLAALSVEQQQDIARGVAALTVMALESAPEYESHAGFPHPRPSSFTTGSSHTTFPSPSGRGAGGEGGRGESRESATPTFTGRAQPAGPVVCPMLDPATGACPVYLHRPVACRTYGFYAQRDLGLYCGDIEKQVSAGKLADVVWGNHDAIDRRLAGLGESRSLVEWFERDGLAVAQ